MRALILGSAFLSVSALAVPFVDEPIGPGGGECFFPELQVLNFGNQFFDLQLESPRIGSVDAPLNSEIRLRGFLGDLDAGFFRLRLTEDSSDTEVPFTRRGRLLEVDGGLSPNTNYTLHVDCAFDEGPLDVEEDCRGSSSFRTGTEIDETPPVVDENQIIAHAFVHGLCSNFNTNNTITIGIYETDYSDITRLQVSTSSLVGGAQNDFDGHPDDFLSGTAEARFEFGTTFNETLSLGDEVRVAISMVDAAGNVSEPVLLSTSARPSTDLDRVDSGRIRDLEPISCPVEAATEVALEGEVPSGGLVEVNFPFETVPLVVRRGEDEVSLIPIEDIASGQRLMPARALDEGEWTLASLPCDFCVCEGCASGTDAVISVGPAGTTAPESPRITGLDELIDPPLDDLCSGARSGIIVFIEPGDDDTTATTDLRYDAAVRIEDNVPVQAGRLLRPEVDAQGRTLLRLESAQFGRLLVKDLQVEIRAVDLNDNRSTPATFDHVGGSDSTPACSSTEVGSGTP